MIHKLYFNILFDLIKVKETLYKKLSKYTFCVSPE